MVKRMLNTMTYPKSAPAPIQYHFASVKKPRDLSTSTPKIVLDPWRTCNIVMTIRTIVVLSANNIVVTVNYIKTYPLPFLSKELVYSNSAHRILKR